MAKKKNKNQISYLIDFDPNHKITEFTHALIPARLYEVLFRTACEWAMNGDAEAAQWFVDELYMFSRMATKREYNSMRINKKVANLYGMPCVVCGKPSDSIDHIIPLKCYGKDAVENMQYQTIAESKIKNRYEIRGDKDHKPCMGYVR